MPYRNRASNIWNPVSALGCDWDASAVSNGHPAFGAVAVKRRSAGTFNSHTFRGQAIGTIELIRDERRDIPIVVVSPIIGPTRENPPGRRRLTLELIHETLAEAVESPTTHGTPNLYHLSGLTLVNDSDLGCDQSERCEGGLIFKKQPLQRNVWVNSLWGNAPRL